MGIARQEAQAGDLVCQIQHYDLAVVLRKNFFGNFIAEVYYTVIGFAGLAMVTEDVKVLKRSRSLVVRNPLFDCVDIKLPYPSAKYDNELMLHLDILTFYEMSNDCP